MTKYFKLMLASRLRSVFITKCYSTFTTLKMSGDKVGVPLLRVLSVLEEFAPKSLSENWDNTGLLIEPYTPRNIKKILLTNDLTEDVAVEANNSGCEMIISYHPPIFAPLKTINQSSWKERVISFLLENRICLYSPHTSWDATPNGVNDWLASPFSVDSIRPITPGVNPDVGAGRFLTLKVPIILSEAITEVKKLCKLSHVRFALGKNRSIYDNNVSTIALCAGSGASVLKGVEADLYITGEMLHHDVLDAAQKGISVILTNHSDSERGFLNGFSNILTNKLEDKVKVLLSNRDIDPLTTL